MATFRALVRDLVGFAGLGAITFGAWLIAAPAGYIVGGVFAVVVSLFAARRPT